MAAVFAAGIAFAEKLPVAKAVRPEKELYKTFANPDARHRPYVRWWWNGARVNEQEILRELDVFFFYVMEYIEIYTEMGRFMMGPYGCLVTTAIHEKHTHKEYIGVDACAVNLMRPAIYGAYHHITVAGKEDAPCDHKYDVTGSLCENSDKFAIDRMLPKIDMGDYLIIHDTGAHGFSMGYQYNGKLRSAELLLKEDGSVQMIRRAETIKDYYATFDFCDALDKLNLK